ncbi:hypothetical protein CCACVL1_00879, partial [Corchorus capsularis]
MASSINFPAENWHCRARGAFQGRSALQLQRSSERILHPFNAFGHHRPDR